MRAIVQRAYGSVDDLHLDDLPRPEPADDEVLVYDARGSGLSQGSPNGWGWGWEHDAAADQGQTTS